VGGGVHRAAGRVGCGGEGGALGDLGGSVECVGGGWVGRGRGRGRGTGRQVWVLEGGGVGEGARCVALWRCGLREWLWKMDGLGHRMRAGAYGFHVYLGIVYMAPA